MVDRHVEVERSGELDVFERLAAEGDADAVEILDHPGDLRQVDVAERAQPRGQLRLHVDRLQRQVVVRGVVGDFLPRVQGHDVVRGAEIDGSLDQYGFDVGAVVVGFQVEFGSADHDFGVVDRGDGERRAVALADFEKGFAGVARRPAAVIAGLLGQLALLPLIAFGVGLAFRLPPVYFLGLLLVACCPGGSSSNVFSMLAKGDVALSVTLTALSSLITLFTIPLVMGFAARFVAVHAGAAIELPVGKLLVQNIVLLFLPMLCGALFRHWRPRAARRVHELLGRVAFPALMLLAAVFFVQYASTILENLGVLGLAAGALILLAMAGGSLLARLFRLRRAVRRTIVIEVGMQNAAQAIAVATSPLIFDSGEMAVPAIVYALVMNVVLLSYLKLLPKCTDETASEGA